MPTSAASGETPPSPLAELVTDRYVDVGDVRLHLVEAGDPADPLVVLLHGFPDCWYLWRHQIPRLVAAGFRVVTPDMRGYNLSDKPPGIRSYRLELLARDMARMIHAVGRDRAHVVGHDWGGNVAWLTAMRYPELVDRLVVLDAPHPERLVRASRDPGQLLRSSYVGFFQLPFLPELMLRARRFFLLRRNLRALTRPGAITDADLARYMDAWSEPGALTGGINYYRAAFRRRPSSVKRLIRPITTPTLVLWGEREPFLKRELAHPSPELVPNARVEIVPDAAHWVQLDQPDLVSERLVEFLSLGPSNAG